MVWTEWTQLHLVNNGLKHGSSASRNNCPLSCSDFDSFDKIDKNRTPIDARPIITDVFFAAVFVRLWPQSLHIVITFFSCTLSAFSCTPIHTHIPLRLICTQEAKQGDFLDFFSSMYCIQHCFICRPSDSTVSEDDGIEPRTVETSALTARRSNHSARSHPLLV